MKALYLKNKEKCPQVKKHTKIMLLSATEIVGVNKLTAMINNPTKTKSDIASIGLLSVVLLIFFFFIGLGGIVYLAGKKIVER